MRSRLTSWLFVIGGLVVVNVEWGIGPAGAAKSADPHPGLTQNWDSVLPAAMRFQVLSDFGNAAVRDNETGLVWEQSPTTTVHIWAIARTHCTLLAVGGRKGWRLPSVHELASLVDPAVAPPGPTLPPGHPFTNVHSSGYWSASAVADNPSLRGSWSSSVATNPPAIRPALAGPGVCAAARTRISISQYYKEVPMQSRRTSRLSGIAARVLIGVLLLTGSGPRIASAASPTTEEILAKVNEVLTALSGIQNGNHTLRWDQALPAAQRFVVLASFANAAVLDKETGLVWEQSPAITGDNWFSARLVCANSTLVRRGWRLPSMPELASLVDPSIVAPPGPTLPPGHPFTIPHSGVYWSATSDAFNPSNAWGVGFAGGTPTPPLSKNVQNGVWCVRGGMNADQY